jgi:DNA-binding MurR/RpiR family transcriptional regulator
MELHKPQFTKNDTLIYEAVMRAPEQVTYLSTNKLAEACGVSQPALSRFVKTLGYARYQDFRSDITAWVAQQHVSEDPNRLFYFEQIERLVRATEQVLTDEYMRDLAHYVLGFDCIFATGIGKSLYPAMLLQGLYTMPIC